MPLAENILMMIPKCVHEKPFAVFYRQLFHHACEVGSLPFRFSYFRSTVTLQNSLDISDLKFDIHLTSFDTFFLPPSFISRVTSETVFTYLLVILVLCEVVIMNGAVQCITISTNIHVRMRNIVLSFQGNL
jgi:hypothetical protein